MKKLLLILLALASGVVRAAEFSFTPDEVVALVGPVETVTELVVTGTGKDAKSNATRIERSPGALAELDGYDRAIDQGPGNPARIVKEPFKLSRDTRVKLAANRAALVKAFREWSEKLADIRLKISGNPDAIDAKDEKQLAAFRAASAGLERITVDLAPITQAELTENDNPVKISTLSVLNLLRPPAEKK